MPVGDETTASCGLNPTPPETGDRNQGSSHPMSSINAAATASSHHTVPPCTSPDALVAGRSSRLSTSGHVDAEQADRPERENDDEHGEDERFAPLAAHQLAAEDVDGADEKAAQPSADDVADPAQHGGCERDDPQPETQAPLYELEVDGVDDNGRGRQRGTDEERHRDGSVDVDAAQQ